MADKIIIAIDKDYVDMLTSTRSYKNKDGVDVTKTEVKAELIQMKDSSQKVVYESDKFKLVKTHFAVKIPTKEERQSKANPVYVGEGITQMWNESSSNERNGSFSAQNSAPTAEDDDLPF